MPPPGGDENQGPAILAAVWTLTGIALLAVAARLFGRFHLRNFGLDDLYIIISMVGWIDHYSRDDFGIQIAHFLTRTSGRHSAIFRARDQSCVRRNRATSILSWTPDLRRH
jgi:hypothetical protein